MIQICLSVVLLMGVASLTAGGDLAASKLISSKQASGTVAADAEVVRYQCPQWKAKHIHDAKKVKTIEATLKKLKCETSRSQHNGHIDLKYRCQKWTELKLKTREEADKWEKWLKQYGFNTQRK
ncbi:MAG: hypothetical protein AAF958_18545 [Planctomycetota bacterium]